MEIPELAARLENLTERSISLTERVLAVELQLKRIVSHLESEKEFIRADIANLERRLFGNGQPGVFDTFNTRLTKLERLAAYVGGAAGIVAGTMGLLLYLLDHWR